METDERPTEARQWPGATVAGAPSAAVLPPVWIRLPDLRGVPDRPATAPLAGTPVAGGQTAADLLRGGSRWLAVGLVAALGMAVYWLVPGSDRGGPAASDDGPPPAWEASSATAPWRGPAVGRQPEGPAVVPPKNEPDRTAEVRARAGSQFLPGQVPAGAGPEYPAVAEFDGTIGIDRQHRAQHERNGSSLY
ncbi:MAG: hypothetical protein A2W31_16100 [Planctomycetes bacterium RBG_16_64_10]|nr:MAG: hypothetical protein A2W31_16100 [Planctomycetes bacterium RBG_16_64_10]